MHIVAEIIPQHSSNHVVANVVPGVAHMTVRVDSGSARVPSDCFAFTRLKLFELVGETVLESESSAVRFFHGGVQKIIINVLQSLH